MLMSVLVPMMAITSSYPTGYNARIDANVGDDAAVLGFDFSDSRGARRHYSPDELRKGVTLLVAFGKTIVHIVGPDFSPLAGGQLKITFLRTFLGDDQREIAVAFSRNGAGWQLATADALPATAFERLHVEVDRGLGIPRGVKRIYLYSGELRVRDYDPLRLPRATHRILPALESLFY